MTLPQTATTRAKSHSLSFSDPSTKRGWFSNTTFSTLGVGPARPCSSLLEMTSPRNPNRQLTKLTKTSRTHQKQTRRPLRHTETKTVGLKGRKEHGGSINRNKRKEARPINCKNPLHVVLKSEKAKGPLYLPYHHKTLKNLIKRCAKKYKISIYEQAIAHNHLHLLIRGKSRKSLHDFFRMLAGLSAKAVTGATKGKPFGRFWTYLLYSRLMTNSAYEFEIVSGYILQNELETQGLIPYSPRKRKRTYA